MNIYKTAKLIDIKRLIFPKKKVNISFKYLSRIWPTICTAPLSGSAS